MGKLLVLLAAFVLLAPLVTFAVQGQSMTTVRVETAALEYRSGDTVEISGEVNPVRGDRQIVIQVYNPKNALVRIDPVVVSANGSFSYSFVIGGPLNRESGMYRGVASYSGVNEEFSFAFTSTELIWQSYSVQVDGKSYNVLYSISNGIITRIAADSDLTTLTLGVITMSDGELIVQIPVATFPGRGRAELAVFIDTIPVDVTEIMNTACRTQYTIKFDAGTEEIELIGAVLLGETRPGSPIELSYHTEVPIKAEGEEIDLQARMNADDCDFSFMQSEKRLHVDVDGPQGQTGYFEIALPHGFLGGNFTVLLNGEVTTGYNTTYNQATENGQDSTTLSLLYDGNNVKRIDIIGTTAIPEFGWLAAAASVSTIGVIISRLCSRIH